MQNRHGNDETTVEPVGNVDVRAAALHDGAEEHQRVGYPDNRDGDVDGPFEFGVLLGGGQTLRQGEDGGNHDGLPAPERKCGQAVRNQPRLTGPLDNIIGRGKQCRAPEAEDNQVGMQGTKTAKVRPGQIQVH